MDYNNSRIRIKNACLKDGQSIFNFYAISKPDKGILYFHRSAKFFFLLDKKQIKHYESNRIS